MKRLITIWLAVVGIIAAVSLMIGAPLLAAPYNITTIVKEGTSGWMPMTFKDQNGSLVTPCTVHITVTDEQSGTILIPEYTPAPSGLSSSIVEPVNNCASKIVNPGQNTTENRLYAVRFTYLGCATATPGSVTGTDYARYSVEDIPSQQVTGTYPNCTVSQAPTPTPRV